MARERRSPIQGRSTGHLSSFLGVCLVLSSGVLGCASESGADPSQPGFTRRDNRIIHEACKIEAKDARRVDANGDGKADVTIVVEDGKEICRAVDLNFDALVDSWIYFDSSGKVRRRENDFDRDGRLDEITVYRAGVIVEKHRATSEAGKLDTWHFFDKGNLTRSERDSNFDGVIDQWWEYPRKARLDCPLIHSDPNGDGRPDLGATVDVCGEGSGYVPPERASDTASGKFESTDTSSLPTEVVDRPAESIEQKAPGAGGSP